MDHLLLGQIVSFFLSLQPELDIVPTFETEPELTTFRQETSQVSSTEMTSQEDDDDDDVKLTPMPTPEKDQLDFSKFLPSSEANRDFSSILLNKARAKPTNFTDSTDGLSVPGNGVSVSGNDDDNEISSTPIFVDENPIFVDVNSPATSPFFDDFSSFESSTQAQVKTHGQWLWLSW